MKKILFTAIAAVLLAGCAKSVDEPVAKEIKVEFEIAEKSAFGADTKALKEGWAVGDMIRVAFSDDSHGYGNTFPILTDNDYTISFYRQNDGTWRVGKGNLQEDKLQDLNGFGKYKAIHYPGEVNFGTSDQFGTEIEDYNGGEYLVAEGEYELVGNVLTILGVIEMKRPDNLMQISVDNLHIYGSDGDTYTLTIEDVEGVTHLKSGSLYLDSQANVCVNANNPSNAQGVTVGDDRAFCFSVMDSSNIDDVEEFEFVLSDGNETWRYTTQCTLEPGKAYLLPSLTQRDADENYLWTE